MILLLIFISDELNSNWKCSRYNKILDGNCLLCLWKQANRIQVSEPEVASLLDKSNK